MTNKHEAAIERQQYTPKLISGTCGNCAHRVAKKELPAWMRGNPEYTPEKHGIESNTCGIGGFPVKKLGSCCEHAFDGRTDEIHKAAGHRYMAQIDRERAERAAKTPDGGCIDCEGSGEQGGQFCGGFWPCESCGGTGKA